MKLNMQERKDGIWLSKEELTNLMETLTKEARDEQDEVKKAFAYGKAVLAKDLLCRIKEPEMEKEREPVVFAGLKDDDLIFYYGNDKERINMSHGIIRYEPLRLAHSTSYFNLYPPDEFDSIF
jgi:hypothetical protein